MILTRLVKPVSICYRWVEIWHSELMMWSLAKHNAFTVHWQHFQKRKCFRISKDLFFGHYARKDSSFIVCYPLCQDGFFTVRMYFSRPDVIFPVRMYSSLQNVVSTLSGCILPYPDVLIPVRRSFSLSGCIFTPYQCVQPP